MRTSSRVKLDAENSLEMRHCRVVLKKLSTAEILKWQRPATACTKPAYPSASTQTSVSVTDSSCSTGNSSHPLASVPTCAVIPPATFGSNLNKTDLPTISVFDSSEPHWVNEQRLIELEKTVERMKGRIISMEAVMRDQREELDKLKRVWTQKQWKSDKTEKNAQKVKSALRRSISLKLNSRQNQSLKRSSETTGTSTSTGTLFQKRKLDVDFNLSHQNLDSNLIELSPNRRLPTECTKIEPQTLPGTARSQKSELQCLLQSSHILNHEGGRRSSDSIDPELITTKRPRMIRTYSKSPLESDWPKIAALETGGNDENLLNSCPDEPVTRVSELSVEPAPKISEKSQSQLLTATLSAFPDGWFLNVPPSVDQPPVPRRGCCHSCYEFKVENRSIHCVECRMKISSMKQVYRRDPDAAIPQCSHQLNQPMRGCDGCILRAFITKCNLRNFVPFIIPFHKIDSSAHKENQQVEPGVASNLIYNALPDVTTLLSNSFEQSELSRQISTFPDGWFLVIPDYANKPPTPRQGCCHSCYEYNSLRMQHCETCWSKADKLRDNYLQYPNAPNPQCSHQLNLPMRGCEGCILRAFVVRYNLHHPDACFTVPYNKVDRYVSTDISTNEYQDRSLPITPPVTAVLQNSVETTEQVKPTGASNLGNQNTQLDVKSLLSSMPKHWLPPKRSDSISGFPEDWFQAIPEKNSELPTPRFGQCTSCYEFKRTHGIEGHCKLCREHATIMKKRYLDNPNTPLPKCTHELNKPMRGCCSCSFRAYIITYNTSYPDDPFPVPFEKINAECTLLKNLQNIKLETSDQDPLLPHSDTFDTSELRITSTKTLQSEPYPETTGFPSGWFQEVPKHIYELPTPRHGCCLSCYEYKCRVLGGIHCNNCTILAQGLKTTYLKDPNVPLPQCAHHLNRPMRRCYVCIFRAYILTYNRSCIRGPFAVPYKKAHLGIPLHMVQQNIKNAVLSEQDPLDPSAEYSPVLYYSNSSSASSSTGNEPEQYEICTTGPDLMETAPVPFPDDWFQAVPSEPNVPPMPRPCHCFSCYQLITNGENYSNPFFCETCVSRLDDMKKRFMWVRGTQLPQCKHQINQPMQYCEGCVVQTFAFRYQMLFQKSYFQSRSELATTIEAFPEGWFEKVYLDPDIPPTPFPGHCNACYSLRKPSVRPASRYCGKCRYRLRKLKARYHESRAYLIPQCSHQLNQPMRGCEGCVVKAFAFSYATLNRRPYFRMDN